VRLANPSRLAGYIHSQRGVIPEYAAPVHTECGNALAQR
jgi:hypothetical protein